MRQLSRRMPRSYIILPLAHLLRRRDHRRVIKRWNRWNILSIYRRSYFTKPHLFKVYCTYSVLQILATRHTRLDIEIITFEEYLSPQKKNELCLFNISVFFPMFFFSSLFLLLLKGPLINICNCRRFRWEWLRAWLPLQRCLAVREAAHPVGWWDGILASSIDYTYPWNLNWTAVGWFLLNSTRIFFCLIMRVCPSISKKGIDSHVQAHWDTFAPSNSPLVSWRPGTGSEKEHVVVMEKWWTIYPSAKWLLILCSFLKVDSDISETIQIQYEGHFFFLKVLQKTSKSNT